MSRRDKAVIDELLALVADLRDALDERDSIIALWESGEIQHDVPDVMDFWLKMGRKQ